MHPRIKKLSTDLTEDPASSLGLAIEQAKFCDYVAAGLTATEAYRRATKTKAHEASVRVQACRWMKIPEVKKRIKRLSEPSDVHKDKLLDGEWLKQEVLNGLYLLGTGAQNEKVRYDAWKALGQARHVDAFVQSTGSVFNMNQLNQTNQIEGKSADELRANLIKELSNLSGLALPSPDDVIELDPVLEDSYRAVTDELCRKPD